ncbi:YwiC-like family protein [Actinotalea sp. K2]|nr:YwiC-like family protein [Actinotalea sp. K2]
MLVVPVVVGALRGGPAWSHLLLLVSWLAAYLAFYATGLWLRSRRRARYLPPVRAYALVTAALGGALLVLEPGLLAWAPVYLPLLALSLWLSARRQDRSVLSGMLTVTAAGLMAVVAQGLGTRGDDDAWWVAAVLVTYFAGTVLYVKTMIRERGSRPVYRASVGLHATATAVLAVLLAAGSGPPAGPGLVVLAVLLTLRAATVPRRWPRATPRAVGLGEILATSVLAVLLVLG